MQGNVVRDISKLAETYDYIVVGGGASGLVVANRLTENPNVTVLVVEYGDFSDTEFTTIPGNVNKGYRGNMFNFTSVPQTALNGRIGSVSMGATVGGGTAVNGMVYDRGNKPDFNVWEELGNPGWGWDGIFPYFKKSTDFNPPPNPEDYSYTWDEKVYGNGPVKVSFPRWEWPDTGADPRIAKEIGLPFHDDNGNGGDNVGFSWIPETMDGVTATRSYARTAYWDPVATRPNLHLLVNHYVSTVSLDNESGIVASGVNILGRWDQDAKAQIKASKDVVLAAGAIHTAQILQLSGIGPASHLKKLGINVHQDLPGVGANFQDHPTVFLGVTNTNVSAFNPTILQNQTIWDQYYEQYQKNRTGPLTVAQRSSFGFTNMSHLAPDPAALGTATLAQNALDYLPEIYHDNPTLLAGYLAQRKIFVDRLTDPHWAVYETFLVGGGALSKPLSRGTVLINSTDPNPQSSSLLVDYGALTNPIDLDVSVLTVRFARSLVERSAAARSLGPVETAPGPSVTSDEGLKTWLRGAVNPTFAHLSGTAAMLPKELGGVVDSELRVHGVGKLRIVDASIMPLIPACHLQATVYAVAEKAADIIKSG